MNLASCGKNANVMHNTYVVNNGHLNCGYIQQMSFADGHQKDYRQSSKSITYSPYTFLAFLPNTQSN